jgi:hypothetical protein
VRPPGASRRGGGTPTEVRVFLWRIGSAPRTGTPFAVPGSGRRFVVHPLGRDLPLYRRPLPAPGPDERADRRHVPTPITRREMHGDPAAFYGPDASFAVLVDGEPVGVEEVDVCDVADLPASVGDPDAAAWQLPAEPRRRVVVDPERGRLVLADDLTGEVVVRYHAGTVADLGGGEYDRRAGLATLAGLPTVVAGPGRPAAGTPAGTPADTLADTLATLHGSGVAVLDTGETLAGPVTMEPRAGATLALVAANGRAPVLALTEDLVVRATTGSVVVLDGLLVAGGAVRVEGPPSGRATLVLRDVTLVPGRRLHRDGSPVAPGAPSLVVDDAIDVRAERAVIGGVVLAPDATLALSGSAVDASGGVAIAGPDGAPGGRLDADRTTVLGRVRVTSVGEVTDSLLVGVLGEPGTVTVERRQGGCVRFSFVPVDATVPRRFRCQPAGAGTAERVYPHFTSVRYGDPGYLQLAASTPAGIARGAEDESEPGVHHDRSEPARLTNLVLRLREFVPAAMDAGVCFES